MDDKRDGRKPEEWRGVVGYEDLYQVSNRGQVRRVKPAKNTYVGRIKKKSISARGYEFVGICFGRTGLVDNQYVHALVAEAFIGPRPKGAVINHINGVKTDNWVWNLEYVTIWENLNHAYENSINGTPRPLTMAERSEIIKIGHTQTMTETAECFGVSKNTIRRVLRRAGVYSSSAARAMQGIAISAWRKNAFKTGLL